MWNVILVFSHLCQNAKVCGDNMKNNSQKSWQIFNYQENLRLGLSNNSYFN